MDNIRQSRVAALDAEKQAALKQARESLPTAPMRSDGPAQGLSQWEVVVAYNLDPPYRYAQEFYWLEVIAADENEAVTLAAGWVAKSHENFEATDFVRASSPHDKTLGVDHTGEPLPIFWNLPIDSQLSPGTMIRDPVTGLRVGFIATTEQEDQWLDSSGHTQYRLLVRKPASNADPVCLAPLVRNVAPFRK